jgi:8-oxo-dGTP diphosphatase
MERIGIITNADFGLEHKELNDPEIRIAARAIILNQDGKMALFNKSNKNEYKLPGGGVEEGEDVEIALRRECLEETGCNIEIVKELCTIDEHRENYNFTQTSYVYVTKVVGEPGKLHLTEKEIAEGGRLIWVTPQEGYELIKDCINNLHPSIYEDVYTSKFVVLRDRKILEYYLDNH